MPLPKAPTPPVPEGRALEDAALVARLRTGDEQAFATVFRLWYALLVRFSERIVGDRARAEEVVQDTLLQLWRRRASLDPRAAVQAWLFHAVRNRALNVVRHDGIVVRATAKLVSSHGIDTDLCDPSDADTALAEAELHLAIDAAVAALPPRCREVFLLSRRHGLRQTQIAVRLGISLKAVEAQITRALRELRTKLLPLLSDDTRPRPM